MSRVRGVLFAVAVLCLTACQQSKPTAESSSSAAPAAARPKGVQFIAAPQGRLVHIIKRERARAQADGYALLVYVGAAWCEPCQRFHQAAAAGKLDEQFPKLRLLELDRDRDEKRLENAGCLSQLIPLFSHTTHQGRCSTRRIFGSVKGPGAIANITPRLKALLAAPR